MSEQPAPGSQDEAQPQHDAARRHPNGARALTTLGRFLVEDGWSPRPAGPAAFTIDYRGESGAFELRAEVLVAAEQLVITAMAPDPVPPARRAAAAEYLTRAAWGLYVGALQLDLDSGAATARCGVDFEGEPLSPRLIRNALAATVRLMGAYLPGLEAVSAGADPRAAVAQAERREPL
jgi:hypothetical protein